jgi:hypothetical protein
MQETVDAMLEGAYALSCRAKYALNGPRPRVFSDAYTRGFALLRDHVAEMMPVLADTRVWIFSEPTYNNTVELSVIAAAALTRAGARVEFRSPRVNDYDVFTALVSKLFTVHYRVLHVGADTPEKLHFCVREDCVRVISSRDEVPRARFEYPGDLILFRHVELDEVLATSASCTWVATLPASARARLVGLGLVSCE